MKRMLAFTTAIQPCTRTSSQSNQIRRKEKTSNCKRRSKIISLLRVGSQDIPGITGKFGFGVQNEVGQRLTRVWPREHTAHSKHPVPTHKRRFYTWASPDGYYRNQIEYILCS